MGINKKIICALFLCWYFLCTIVLLYADDFKKRYNIIIIVIDTLRADHLGCYGYFRNTSPNIDKLAHKGILFANAFSQATWTLPSFASLFTSKYVPTHKIFNINCKLNDAEITLAEILKIFGYKTAAFTSGIFLNRKFNLNQGFDIYEDILFEPLDTYICSLNPPKKAFIDMYPKIIMWLKDNHANKFFLFLHIMDVHPPFYLPEDGDDDFFDPNYRGIIDTLPIDLSLKADVYGNLVYRNGKFLKLSSKDKAHIVAHYDAAIRYTDRYIGRFLQELDKMHLMKNTVIILTADHGIDLFEHNTLFNYPAQLPYNEIIHIPLIIYHPRISGGKKIYNYVQLIDCLPTILDILRLPPKKDAEGRSLLPLIEGKDIMNWNNIVYSIGNQERNKNLSQDTEAFITGRWKLLRRGLKGGMQYYELYDYEKDPYEMRNLIYEKENLRDNLIIKFIEWKASMWGEKK